jgi:hypothetical protein
MKTNDLRHPFFLFIVIVFCLHVVFMTASNPSSKTSFPLTALPDIKGEAISFLGDTFQASVPDVEAFLQADSLLEEAGNEFHADSTDLNAIIWYG